METTTNVLSLTEAASRLGITNRELVRWIYDEDFPSVWVDGRLRVPADAVAKAGDPT